MAGTGLIVEYLDAFRARVRTRRDHADLVDEVADHLYSAAERLEALGIDREAAERRALARFGDPRLVAALVTAVPTKGNLMSLFFSRHLGWVCTAAAVLWIAAIVATYFGYTALSGSWTSDRYLLSAVIVGLSCLATNAALIGLNLRAFGRMDAATVVIGVIGCAAAFFGTMMSWVLVVWLPLLAIAVTWTLARARRAQAGSRVFTTVLLVAVPILGVAAIAVPVIGAVASVDMEGAAWAVTAGLAAVLVAGLADIAVRLSRRIREGRTAVA